jgi:hypothetical protein
VFVVAKERTRNPVGVQKFSGVTSILCSDKIDFPKNPQGPNSYILQVADRCSHNVKGSGIGGHRIIQLS